MTREELRERNRLVARLRTAADTDDWRRILDAWPDELPAREPAREPAPEPLARKRDRWAELSHRKFAREDPDSPCSLADSELDFLYHRH